MKRRYLITSVVIAATIIGAFLTPFLMRRSAFFQIRQIQLVGVHFHAPDRLIRALDLAPDRNLFESLSEIEERATALPGVESAKAKRRMPGTLTIVVEEVVPVAFLSTSTGMLALDAEGTPLTYDATATGLDLPIVETADSTLTGVLSSVLNVDSTLFQDVDAAKFAGEDFVIIEIGQTDVIMRREPTKDDINAVAMVRRHLMTTGRPFDELDVRFEGRVIVRWSGA